MGTDCTGSCKSNYHMITTTTVPKQFLYSLKNGVILHFRSVSRHNGFCVITFVQVDISIWIMKSKDPWHCVKLRIDLGYFSCTHFRTRGPNVLMLIKHFLCCRAYIVVVCPIRIVPLYKYPLKHVGSVHSSWDTYTHKPHRWCTGPGWLSELGSWIT